MLMCDGAVVKVKKDFDAATMKAIVTRKRRGSVFDGRDQEVTAAQMVGPLGADRVDRGTGPVRSRIRQYSPPAVPATPATPHTA